jgi:adenine-specific DNA-methyltransferase
MNKLELISKIKQIEGISQDERAYLVELVNTKKKYGLVWEDKPEEVEEQLRENLPVLKEVKEKAIINGEEHPNHILIEGDNLHALTALTFTHEGKIDVIYIDPPYNTGNKDFVYHDAFKDGSKFIDREHPFRHSTWLSFIIKRLKIAKKLLSKKGIIFISIDDNEFCQLKLVCDEVFGENNCENIFTIKVRHENRILRQDIRYHQTTEYLLAYRKTNDFVPPRRSNERDTESDYRFKIELTGPPTKIEKIGGYDVEVYNIDSYSIIQTNPGEGDLKSYSIRGSLITQSGSASEFYENNLKQRKIQDGFNTLYKVVNMGTRGDGLGYRFIMQPPNKAVRNGIYFQGKPIKSKSDTGLPYPNFFDFVNEFNNVGYEGGIEFKNGKKPLDFLSKVFELANYSNNLTILDFFGGSGSTLHSVMQLNEKFNFSNTCILVTNNENSICERITYNRLKNAINGYVYDSSSQIDGLINNNLRYYKSEFVPSSKTERNKRLLTQASTELICIKEDCYQEITSKEGFDSSLCTIFTNGKGKYLIVVYHSREINEVCEKLVEYIQNLEVSEKVKLYGFSPEKETLVEDFIDVQDKIEAVPLPEAIYNAYRATFRILKLDKKPISATSTTDEEGENTLFDNLIEE